MYLFAYRRKRSIFAQDDTFMCIARYHPETYTLQMLTTDGRALAEPILWNTPPETEQGFYAWVDLYKSIWSLNPEDAFWFDADLTMDVGL